MAHPNEAPRQSRNDDDRRANDRRRALDRRAPPPLWRRPWAFVAYGVLGGLAVVLLWASLRGGGERARNNDAPLVKNDGTAAPAPAPEPGTPPPAPPAPSPAPGGAAQEATGAAGFERLMLEGAAAQGRLVRTELYCEQPTSYQVKTDVLPDEPAVAALSSEGRIPAADCKWGGANDPRREDFLLLVPPALAGQFAAAPVISDDFQRRRRVVANVEWLGRSPALSLRTAGVFRGAAR